MTTTLGTLEELPLDYRQAMQEASIAPLWPMLRGLVPPNHPHRVSRACLWPFERVRPLLLRAGTLTPVEKAERRVLALCDPGRGGATLQATSTIYVGLQLLLPGEKAPAHRHTPSAARIIVEGEDAYTIVGDETCPMFPGDLILTPGGIWHEHGHAGNTPVIWLDALDLPLFVYLESSYSEEGRAHADPPLVAPPTYTQPGLVPSRRFEARSAYPMLRFPWQQTEAALRRLAETASAKVMELDYVNPETGDDCLPTLGFTAMMLLPGQPTRPPLRSASAVFHVVGGSGRSTIDDDVFSWTRGDTFSAPVFARVEHMAADGPAFLIRIHDAPLQRKLRLYEERP